MKTYHIVRKLDAADSNKVVGLVEKLTRLLSLFQWSETSVDSAELIIAIGGDGTVMHGLKMSATYNRPCIGINIGNLGFLAEINPSQLESDLVNYLSASGKREVRTLITEHASQYRAINEFYISPVLSKDTLSYEFFVDGVSSGTHRANGLLISTPTGSTAFSLSVGGSIVQPSAPVFQITPVAPMSLNSRSVIVSDTSEIEVEIQLKPNTQYSLVGDGQVIYEISFTDETPQEYYTFSFNKSDKVAILDHKVDWNFFEVLTEKLKWNTAV